LYLNHEDLSKYWIIDIEADSLTPTTIWCAVAINCGTNEIVRLVGRDALRTFIQSNPEAIWVGHNALSFDIPQINRLCDTNIPTNRVVDTLVLSYLYDPRIPGGHSLEAWGERFKMPKGDFDDFSKFSQEMLTYCEQDVRITLRLFLAITSRMRKVGFSEKSCQLEHEIRHVVNKQQVNGWYFDIPAASALLADIRQQGRDLESGIREIFPAELVLSKSNQLRRKSDGSYFANVVRDLETYPKVDIDDRNGEYHCFEWSEFNIGSPKQRIERLLSLGWEPTKYTEKGNPQVDEDSLLAFAETSKEPQVKAIAEWLVLFGRGNMINTWLNNVNYDDSRMHGTVFTCGAGTRRMTHSGPNTANIPKAKPKVKYGKECRALWTVGDKTTRRQVGYDAKGLEMRMFGHYLGNPEAARLYIEGDPHQFNADLLSVDRDPIAKNVFYALIYGARDPKLGETGGHDKKWGKWARGVLTERTPGLAELTRQITAEYENGGWIRCIDGGFVRCPSPHAALNYKLQSAGSIAMKQTSIFIDERVQKKGWDVLKVGDIHDEGQHDADARVAEEFGHLCVQAIRDAGEELNFSVPLDGEYKVGLSWAETH
jgi:DNA polymerase-1